MTMVAVDGGTWTTDAHRPTSGETRTTRHSLSSRHGAGQTYRYDHGYVVRSLERRQTDQSRQPATFDGALSSVQVYGPPNDNNDDDRRSRTKRRRCRSASSVRYLPAINLVECRRPISEARHVRAFLDAFSPLSNRMMIIFIHHRHT